jgi:hypothetical protein
VAVPDGWTVQLADAIAAALHEFSPRLGGEKVALLAVDCHPWHGSVDLAVLTASEVATDPLLADPAEMAAWRYHNITRELSSWEPVERLGREMQSAYESGDRRAVAEGYLRACATAVTSTKVVAALRLLERSSGFRVSVAHPDDGREFVPAG